jgi:tetratricopeptide (TPR) repeat protein
VLEKLKVLIDRIEGIPLSPGMWIASLSAIIVLRNYLEAIAGQQQILGYAAFFIHYPLAYFLPVLGLSILLSAFSGERIEKITKLMLFVWLLTLLPPLIDMLLSLGAQRIPSIGYLATDPALLGSAFVNFLNPFHGYIPGTTPGIRIEAFLGIILTGLYVFIKTRRAKRAVGSAVLMFIAFFAFFSLPTLVLGVLKGLGASVSSIRDLYFVRAGVYRGYDNIDPMVLSNLSVAMLDSALLVGALALWLRRFSARAFTSVFSGAHFRFPAFLSAAAIGGILLGSWILYGDKGVLAARHPYDFISMVAISLAVFLVSSSQMAWRRDEIDPDRPTVAPAIVLVLGLLLAMSVGYPQLVLCVAIAAVAFLLFQSPIPFLEILPIRAIGLGGATLLAVSAGYSLFAGHRAAIWFPRSLTAAILVSTSLVVAGLELCGVSVHRRAAEALKDKKIGLVLIALGIILLPVIPRAYSLLIFMVPLAAVLVAYAYTPKPNVVAVLGLSLVIGAVFVISFRHPTAQIESDLSQTSFARAQRVTRESTFVTSADMTEEQRYLNEGVGYFSQGNLGSAIESFKRAIELDPGYSLAHANLGLALREQGQIPEAFSSLRKAVALDSLNAIAHTGLGEMYQETGDAAAAEKHFKTAIEIDPEAREALIGYGLLLRKLGRLDESRRYLEQARELDPSDPIGHLELANLDMLERDYASAIENYQRALVTGSTAIYIQLRLAEAYYALGDLENAREQLEIDVSRFPDVPETRGNLARIYARLGRTDDAIREVEKAITLTNDPALLERLRAQLDELRSGQE